MFSNALSLKTDAGKIRPLIITNAMIIELNASEGLLLRFIDTRIVLSMYMYIKKTLMEHAQVQMLMRNVC